MPESRRNNACGIPDIFKCEQQAIAFVPGELRDLVPVNLQ
jgi:hypothetical protein